MFNAFSRFWAFLAIWLDTGEVAGSAINDLAHTGKVQTDLILKTAQRTALAELRDLDKELDLS